MRIHYEISDFDAQQAKQFFDKWADSPFVRTRKRRNVDAIRDSVDMNEFWEALVSALLTTQQRSGPQSAVYRLISSSPFPLSLQDCRDQRPCGAHVRNCITSFGGIRRGRTIGADLEANLEWLEGSGWSTLIPKLQGLESNSCRDREREVAKFLAASIRGLGPKQSRNVLQMLGLTQHETPIDSRITKWLNKFGFPINLSATSLSDESYYEFVADGFQAICNRIEILPCMMDAAIFASFDGDAWNQQKVAKW